MQGIDVMVEEHKNILRFSDYLKNICCDIIEGAEVDTKNLRECIAFARNYADKYHHEKEEEILFKVMMEQSGDVAQKLIRHGMLVEHDLLRYYITELENGIMAYECEADAENKFIIISNAGSYVNLIKRHIEKEDTVVYEFAKRELSEEILNDVGIRGNDRDNSSKRGELKDKYLSWLEKKTSVC